METNVKSNGNNGNGKSTSTDIDKVASQVQTQATAKAIIEVRDMVQDRIATQILDRIDQTITEAFSTPIEITTEQIQAMHVMSLARTIQGAWNARARAKGYLPSGGKR